MLYILTGRDEFSLREALRELEKSIGEQALLSVNTTTLEGQQMTLNQLKAVGETAPFMGEKRLVIIEGLLERFEPKRKTGGRKKETAGNKKTDDTAALADYLTQLPDSTSVVLVDSDAGNNNPLLKKLTARAQVRRFPLLRDSQLRQWVQRRVKAEGGTISPQAVDMLARLVGSNLWIMANEINKLILYTAGRHIEEADVRVLAGYAHETSVFVMIDAIIEAKAGVAEQLLQQLLLEGSTPASLLAMLSRQVHMIFRAMELVRQRQSRGEIQKRLGLTSDFALLKVLEQAGKYSLERLREIYNRLLDTDLAIKTGKYDGELALNILIADLCRRDKAPSVVNRY